MKGVGTGVESDDKDLWYFTRSTAETGDNRGIEKRRIEGYHFYERECSLLSLGFPLRGDSRCRLHESNGQTVMEDGKNPE